MPLHARTTPTACTGKSSRPPACRSSRYALQPGVWSGNGALNPNKSSPLLQSLAVFPVRKLNPNPATASRVHHRLLNVLAWRRGGRPRSKRRRPLASKPSGSGDCGST